MDDPYSHLAVQKLDALRDAYDVAWRCHLVSQSDAEFLGSAAHFDRWAWADAKAVAGDYGVDFAPAVHAPDPTVVTAANAVLATYLDGSEFAAQARAIGEALWRGEALTTTDPSPGAAAIDAGNALRNDYGHYQGAMLYFEGEWFWGIDRMRTLEQRLIDEGFGTAPIQVPEPTPLDTTALNTDGIVLEYFPSLRSPYTAIGHRRVLELIERSRVEVRVRPIMPMMMRGIPAPRPKQRYVITDSAREGRHHGSPMAKIVDPFGAPVQKAFALFPGAQALDGGMAFVTAYLQAAWVDGVDICTERGLRIVAERAGLPWDDLVAASAEHDWRAVLDANLETMLAADLWGVPSFRVLGGEDHDPYACWGQDRIWRVENEIARRSASTS